MAIRMTRRGTAFALLLSAVVVVVAVWGFFSLAPRPPAVSAAPDVIAAPAADVPPASFAGQAPAARAAQPLTPDATAPAPGVVAAELSAEVARAGAIDAVAALVIELERLDAERPITFHVDAARTLEAFVQAEVVTRVGSEVVATALDAELDARAHAPRVGGALLAVLGGLGGAERVFTRLPMDDQELHRSAMAGLAWGVEAGGSADAMHLRPADFLLMQPRAGLSVLDLEWNRPPGEAEQGWLLGQARMPAGSLVALLQRELAVLALGIAIDERADMLEQFRTWLMDREATTQQLRPAIAYVLAHARGAEAREVLQRFLADEQVGDYGKLLARWWLSKQPAMEGDLKVLAAPLMDPESTDDDRIMAAGALLSRVAGASESDLAQLEELLAMRVLQEQDRTARLAAIAVLVNIPGGFLRLGALDQALRAEADPRHRKVAARGLAATQGALRQEALAMLRAALSFEQDPSLKEFINHLLATSEQ